VGSGEPTLHASIGWLIRQVKDKISNIPVAVITNGALLHIPEVRQELLAADAVLPSLDAGTAKLYRQINRPHARISFKRHLEGLVSFRNEFEGKLWIEVMLVRGLNDTEEALGDIAAALQRIKPDEVHINSPTRPPVETWIQPTDEEGLLRAREIFGKHARVVSLIEGTFHIEECESIVDAIIGIITRHPVSEEELFKTLKEFPQEIVSETLKALQVSGRVQVVKRHGTHFWSGAPSIFPTETQSQSTSPEHMKSRSRSVQKDKNSHRRMNV
jgi:wyosine [tRNA(Phe)-imidazoG37] synthetase (radical SAM superfamily)